MYDTIIVGGGIAGISTAYYLVAHGAKTLLIDRFDAGRATDAGAGIMSPETYSVDSEAWYHFAVEAYDDYPTLIEQLKAEGADETGYARQDWADRLKTELAVNNSIGMQLRLIPPGEFMMGSPESEADRGPTKPNIW